MGCYTEIDGLSDVVFKIVWALNGQDGNFYASALTSTEVPYVAGQPFTPYEDLTQEQVLGWIDQYTPAEQITTLETQVSESIATQQEIQYPKLPWVTSPA